MPVFTEQFSVDSALLKELGERLVTTPHVAIAELVKNAYDADATEVTISIRENKKGGPEIEISDNGRGMTLQQIKDYWMRIGTTHKNAEKRSELYGRPLSGSKGIGRFCVRRLGTSVVVESSAQIKNAVQLNRLEIDWTKFVAGKEVSAITVQGDTHSQKTGSTGLKLTMTGHPVNEWKILEDQRSYNYLLRRLATLTANQGVSQDGYMEDPGFKVILDAPALELGSQVASILQPISKKGAYAVDVRQKLMNAGWALLSAEIDTEGRIKCSIKANHPVGVQTHTSSLKLSRLTDVKLTLAIFVEEPGWNREEKLVPLGKLNEILNDWGGVQVRHRRMRVFPYGDPGDDWLEIERDRGRRLGRAPDELTEFVDTLRTRAPGINPGRVLLNILSAKAFLGGVEIGENQLGLEQRADRQGFIANSTFNELKHFARYAVNWAMIWRDFAVKDRDRAKAEKLRNELDRTRKGNPILQSEQGDVAIKTLRQGIQQLRNNRAEVSKQDVETLAVATGLIEAEFNSTRSDLVRFQLVASAATLSLLYHHEIQFLSSALDSLGAELRRALGFLKDQQHAVCARVLETLNLSKESLDSLGDLTQDMGVLDRKALAISLDLADNVERAVARFKRVCLLYNIDITERIDEGLVVAPMLKGELAAILLNIVSNAIKAVIAKGGAKRMIELRGYRKGRKICLDVKDDGIGLPPNHYNAVFTPLVSDPDGELYDNLEEKLNESERHLLGQGSGLGLSIVKGVLERRNGSVTFLPPTTGWSTYLHLEFAMPSK